MYPQKRAACSGDGILVAELSDGVITDALNRTGYIASNFQFQFDKPPQAGAIYTAGFSHCNNGSLALGGSAVFYQCRSGSFSNLYDRWWAMQCSPVEILVMPCGSDNDEGQHVVGTSAMTMTVTVPLSDGHTKVITTTQLVPICQIDDGKFLFQADEARYKLTAALGRSNPGPHHPLHIGRLYHSDSGYQHPARVSILGRPDTGDTGSNRRGVNIHSGCDGTVRGDDAGYKCDPKADQRPARERRWPGQQYLGYCFACGSRAWGCLDSLSGC
jgi:hypothetical protein